jgi:hypothetical protein
MIVLTPCMHFCTYLCSIKLCSYTSPRVPLTSWCLCHSINVFRGFLRRAVITNNSVDSDFLQKPSHRCNWQVTRLLWDQMFYCVRRSQEVITGHCPEPDESSPNTLTLFFIVSSLKVFRQKIVLAFITFLLRRPITCLAHLSLIGMITTIGR